MTDETRPDDAPEPDALTGAATDQDHADEQAVEDAVNAERPDWINSGDVEDLPALDPSDTDPDAMAGDFTDPDVDLAALGLEPTDEEARS